MPCLQVHARHNIACRLREAKVNGELLCLLVFSLTNNAYITLRSGGESALRRMNSAGRLWVKSLLFLTAIATFRSKASISSVFTVHRSGRWSEQLRVP